MIRVVSVLRPLFAHCRLRLGGRLFVSVGDYFAFRSVKRGGTEQPKWVTLAFSRVCGA